MKTRNNREWKTFHKRWNATRFEKFVIISLIVHLILGVLVGVPAYFRYQEKERQKEEVALKKIEKEKAKEEAVQEGDEEVKEVLKDELANEQLKEFYEELVSDLLPSDLAELYWDELLEDLELDLDEFAELFENMEEFEVELAEEKLQEIKESMLGKLTEMLRRDHEQSLMEELLAQARKIAQEIAANYQKELGKRIGQPVGEGLKKTIEKEESAAIAKLRYAERELDAAMNDIKNVVVKVSKAKESLQQDATAMRAANQQEDKKAETAVQARARQKRNELNNVAAHAANASKRVDNASKHLEFHMPAAAEFLKQLEKNSAAKSMSEARASADHAQNGDPANATERAESSERHALTTLTGLQRAQAAVQLRIAGELANKLARESSMQSREAEKLDQTRKAAQESGDFKAAAQVTRELAYAQKKAEQTDTEVPGLESQVTAAHESLKKAAASAAERADSEQTDGDAAVAGEKEIQRNGKDIDGEGEVNASSTKVAATAEDADSDTPSPKVAKTGEAEEPEKTTEAQSTSGKSTENVAASGKLEEEAETGGARLSAKTLDEASEALQPNRYKPELEAAQKELHAVGESLKAQQPSEASRKLKSASERFQQLQAAITRSQKAVGFGEGKSIGQEVLEEVDELRQGKLSEHVREKFDNLYAKNALPTIMKKVGDSVDKRLSAERVVNKVFKAELKKELERIFGDGVTDDVKADVAFAEQAAERLPEVHGEDGETENADDGADEADDVAPEGEHAEGKHGPHGKSSKHVKSIVAGAEGASTSTADRQMPSVIKAGLYAAQSQLSSLANSSEDGQERAAALERLGNLQNQLDSGRTGFLEQPGRAGLAAARQRQVSRKQSLIRFRGIGDVDAEAYKKIVALIKERGHVAGAAFDLKGAEGDIEEVEDESSIQPAMVAVPASVEASEVLETEADERHVDEPVFKTNRFAGIPFLFEDTIKVDGNLDDWKDLPSIQLLPVVKGGNKGVIVPKELKAWVAYGSAGMWFAVDVVDTSGKLENHVKIPAFWLNDCVEIFLDTLNTKFNKRGESSTHQFFAFPFGHKDNMDAGVFEAYMEKSEEFEATRRIPYPQSVAPRVAKKTEKGWSFEMMIPKKLLRKGEIKPGSIIGFNYQIDTGSDVYYYWSSNIKIISSLHPNTWGDIQFLGSDAKVEAFTASDTELSAIVPGSPFKLRITDPDMNLSDLLKDKISATIRTDGGDFETVILQETGFKTGVFEGLIATRLNIGGSRQGLLEVFEGERVRIEYVDQAQAYGERNVPVKYELRVGSIGLKLSHAGDERR